MNAITHEQRLELYEQGMTDRQIADVEGVPTYRIGNWRYWYGLPNKNRPPKKPPKEPVIHVPMETVLTEPQCEAMRAFLGSLEQLKKDIRPGTKVNILSYAKAWGEKYFQNKTKEEVS